MAPGGTKPAVEQHPELLMAARQGDWKRLKDLLSNKDATAAAHQPTASVPGVVVDIEEAETSDINMDVTFGLELDTILHVVASNGDSDDYLASATEVHGKAKHLLDASNDKGDTPLHCAARAGRIRMVSHLIDLMARSENAGETGDGRTKRTKEVLRKPNNQGRTALHEALRLADNKMVKDMVEVLMSADTELARIPQTDGTSPLYLAVSLGHDDIAELLYTKDKELGKSGELSYSGPDGQNALHAAVLRSKEVTKKLLEWNEDLTTQRDKNGNTPLHFAASRTTTRQERRDHTSVCWQVLKANPNVLYESNREGLFPIHVAASAGERGNVAMFLMNYPSSAGLCDTNGSTFLHVAIKKHKVSIVSCASNNQSISWILNMQDNEGNTALHLAVQSSDLLMFCPLFGNRQVHLNLTNEEGLTPLDISRDKIPHGIHFQNDEHEIHGALLYAGATNGVRLQDSTQTDDKEEKEKVKDSAQTLCSALIATVTFGATFAVPGGYRADDHTNGGTPVLAGKYVFHAFMMTNTFAFICSSIATIGLMYSCASLVNSLRTRQIHLGTSAYFMYISITSLTAAFALGAYMVLAPVAHKTAIAICVLSSLVVLYGKIDSLLKQVLLAKPFYRRKGLIRTLAMLAQNAVALMVFEFWPLIFSFGWAAYATNHPVAKIEPPIQPPIPLA